MGRTGTRLDYSYYSGIFTPHLSGDASRDALWHRKAERLHALGVNDALVEIIAEAIQVAKRMKNRTRPISLRRVSADA